MWQDDAAATVRFAGQPVSACADSSPDAAATMRDRMQFSVAALMPLIADATRVAGDTLQRHILLMMSE